MEPYRKAWRARIRQEQEELARRKSQLLAAARACAKKLREVFQVTRVLLIGSLARDGPITARSDIDLAVEGLPDARYLEALGDITDLACDLVPGGVQVDLITLESAHASMFRRANTTGVPL